LRAHFDLPEKASEDDMAELGRSSGESQPFTIGRRRYHVLNAMKKYHAAHAGAVSEADYFQ
jgi:hypothetical protein